MPVDLVSMRQKSRGLRVKELVRGSVSPGLTRHAASGYTTVWLEGDLHRLKKRWATIGINVTTWCYRDRA